MENEMYIKGFNHGYLLVKYKPTILKGLVTTKSLSDYFMGILEVKREFEQDKIRTKSQELNKLQGLKKIDNKSSSQNEESLKRLPHL